MINKRLRATDGCHKSFALYTEIHLAYNHYVEFGFDSLIKVLMHEIAHHIRYMKYEDISHGEEFKKLCKKLNGCLNETHAVGKYKNMSYRGIQTPFK
ncbi:MAG: SprT-like domain-containing protein [bacterium]